MRRKLVLVILCLVMAVNGFAQINFNYLQTDSLRQELLKAKNDTGRVLLMANLAEGYRWTSPDSAIYFGQKALELAKQIEFPRGEAAALISISVVQRELGNLAKALDLAMKALAIAQHHQFAIEEVSALIRVANVYSSANNYSKALIYLHQSENQSRNNGNKLYENISQWLIASAFERINNLDSAIYYADKAFTNVSWEAGTDFAYNILGDIQLKLKKDTLALNSYRIGLKEAERASDYRTEANLSVSLANYYKKHTQMDSAVYYAKKGLAVAQILSYKNRIISSSSILADIYETKDPQEALKYYRIYNAAKDSLYGSEKMQALQTLMMDEQEKQKETEAAQLAYQNRVKQLALIGGLLFVLVILSLLYRNNRRKQKANELLQKQKQEIEERKAQAEIETALEKVRTIAMSMRRRDDMLEICKVITGQLTLLKVEEIRNVQTAIFYPEKGTYINYEYYAKHDKTIITETSYTNHEIHQAFADQMLKGQGQFFSTHIEGEKIKDWIAYQKTTNVFIDDFLYRASSLNYYWYSLGAVATGISTYKRLTEEEIKLFNRFLKVFELAYRRYLDIEKAEAQAREAKIEAALERTRTQSMIMQHSKELDDTLRVFHEQVLLLGISSAFSFLWLPDEKNNRHIFWAAWKEDKNGSAVFKSKAINYPLDRNEPATAQCLVDWKSNQPVYSYYVPSAEVENYFAVWQELIDGVEHLKPEYFSGGLHYVEAFMKYGCFGVMVVSDLTEDEKTILGRFAIEFERTYTRFLDLQKAEAQVREGQIEAALERVRSRSMAMHKSDEVMEVANTLYEELQKLEFKFGATTIIIMNKETGDQEHWVAGFSQKLLPESCRVSYFEHPCHDAELTAWKSGEKFLVYKLTGEELITYNQRIFNDTGYKNFPDHEKKWMLELDPVIFSLAFMKHGAIMWAPYPATHDQLEILHRFAKVFEQTYTRFLDLQKAEAQAREAQIQLALERVRARTMAMQQSNELRDAAALLFQQVKSLGAPAYSCGYNIWGKDDKEFTSWMSTQDGSIIDGVPNIPLTEDANFIRYVESKQNGETFFVLELRDERMQEHYQYLKTIPAFKGYFDYAVSVGFDLPETQIHHVANFSDGNLLFITLEPCPEFHDIFKRFAAVFQQTYTRFLDLQKAEAQARESQVQLALERVRARTMAMQKSDELSETAVLLFHQLISLGLELRGCGFNIWEKDEKTCTAWMSGPEGTLSPPFKLPLTEDPFFIRYYESRQNGEDFWIHETGKEELVSRYKYMRTLPVLGELLAKEQEDGVEIQLPSFVVDHVVNFSDGNLVFITHKSYPEAWDIFKRFGKVFEQTYTRFLDLQKAEAQAKEAQIEAALEKVRSRSLAMHTGNELGEVVKVIVEKLIDLGVVLDANGVVLCTYFNNSKNVLHWIVSPDFSMAGSYLLPYFDHPIFNAAWHSKENGDEYFSKSFSVAEKNSFFEYAFEHSDYRYFPEEFKQWIFQNDKHSLSFAWQKNSAILIPSHTGVLPSEEDIAILKRFANVFEQSYVRFLDLQQAEAQARESQIQLALERVRARTMAMQKSDELMETAVVLFDQLKQLGEGIERTIIGVMNEEEHVVDVWATRPDGSQMDKMQKFPIDEPVVMQKVYGAWQQQKRSIVIDLQGEELESYFQFLKGKGPRLKRESFGERRVENFAFFSKGMLGIISVDPNTPANIELYERFAAVFDQTYTRFLDLQKSEAQAREAQIEAALERVRSRTMGMQKSEELKEVIQVVYEQFVHLNILVEHTGFIIDYKTRDDMNIWLADKHAVPFQVTIPYFDCAHWNSFNEAKEKGMDFFANHLSYEEKNKFYGDLFELIPGLPEETLKYYFSCPGLAISTVLLENIGLYIENFSGTPYSDEENNTLMRFGKVFQQTYTRFLDLQKVEAQAREATIESALEKVRGKAMAMHNSNDLSVTASMVFTELRKLGINPIRCGVGLLNIKSRKAQLYSAASSPDGDSLSLVGWVLLENHPVLEKIYDTWQKGEDYFPELTGEQLKHYYELLLAGLPVNVPDWQDGQKQYGHFFSFSIGCLYAWSENPYNDAEIKILKRFASIIDLTFRRYLDLQKSEASTKEAVKQAALDRIRADIASMRTVNDLDRIIPLVWNELTTLGVPFIRCGVFIMKNDEQQIHTFLSTPDGKAIASFHLPYDSPGNISKVVSHWQNNEIYKDHWDDDAFREFANSLVKQGALKSSKQYLSTLPVGGFYLHFVPFLQGMLYVGNTTELGDDELKLLHTVAEAFSTAYARYEDFNKLEAAKQQVEKTLVDLKQAQTQLVQSEKMASLGELTAGIAHEIQNPLNFVNNFSEVSSELMDEIKAELDKGDTAEAKAIADDVKQNLEKIAHHGKRADAIVKSMLQHSRKSSGQKDLVDINALVDEYLRLSYHGFRAKEKSFNAIIESHFDSQIGKIKAAGQDIGRVLLNLFNNAFYAVNEKIKQQQNGFEPTLQVTTTKLKESLEIKIKDNGIGIPEKVLEKIYQPFFTTKPTGEGTGLGLSLSYDIITKGHGGNLKVETEEGEGSEFIILLPTT